MDEKTRVFICLFDGQQFEKFSTKNEATGETVTCYSVDGVKVEEAEWAGHQQRAIARDIAKIFPEKLAPELSVAQCGVARTLWDALVLAPSRSAVDAAYHQLLAAPPLIQQAVIYEMAGTLSDNPQIHSKQNPFGR